MKYRLIYILCATFSLSACNKWLDVSPKTQMREQEQFSSQQGFVDALFGTYMEAASDSLYGNNLSFGMLDILAGRYENKAIGSWYGNVARYTYTPVTTTTGQFNADAELLQTWSSAYNTIAQCNYILRNVDNKVLNEQAYHVITGEALAMRAFIHFDLLRLFAPAYLNGANSARAAIPFMEQFTSQPQAKQTVEQIVNRCEQELLAAQAHLYIDTTAAFTTSSDLYLLYRKNHLNYWAVKATLARLYLYKGDKVKALQFAREVINGQRFRLVTGAEVNNDVLAAGSDVTLSLEHIFAVHVSGLKRISDDLFKPSPTNTASEDTRDLFSTLTKVNTMYESSLPGYGTDMRLPAATRSLWSNTTASGNVYTKKYIADHPSAIQQRVVPVIRLPEMYYIAAEAAATPEEGLTYLNLVRAARGIPAITNPALLDAEIQKEYRKEFYGEGQFWFYLKRKNVATVPDGVGNPMTEAKYTFPLPQNEIEFGK